jgi:transcription termination factor Rho
MPTTGLDINKSGTRKEELLQPKEELNRVWVLRKVLSPLSQVEVMEQLLDKLGKTRSNGELLAAMSGRDAQLGEIREADRAARLVSGRIP